VNIVQLLSHSLSLLAAEEDRKLPLGEHCDLAGISANKISREVLLRTLPHEKITTNGVVLELKKYSEAVGFTSNELCSWILSFLYGESPSKNPEFYPKSKSIYSKIFRVFKLKGKTRDKKLQIFLKQKLILPVK
jgi:hypothetical protein